MKKNPLIVLLNVLGFVGGILTLSSLVQDWWKDLLRWKGFLAVIIDTYRSIVYPIYHTVFSWVSLSPPPWFYDYVTFGLIVNVAFFRSFGRSMTVKSAKDELEEFYEILVANRFGRVFFPPFLYVLARGMFTFLWPALAVPAVGMLVSSNTEERKESIHFFSWLLFILIVLALLLSLNTVL